MGRHIPVCLRNQTPHARAGRSVRDTIRRITAFMALQHLNRLCNIDSLNRKATRRRRGGPYLTSPSMWTSLISGSSSKGSLSATSVPHAPVAIAAQADLFAPPPRFPGTLDKACGRHSVREEGEEGKEVWQSCGEPVDERPSGRPGHWADQPEPYRKSSPNHTGCETSSFWFSVLSDKPSIVYCRVHESNRVVSAPQRRCDRGAWQGQMKWRHRLTTRMPIVLCSLRRSSCFSSANLVRASARYCQAFSTPLVSAVASSAVAARDHHDVAYLQGAGLSRRRAQCHHMSCLAEGCKSGGQAIKESSHTEDGQNLASETKAAKKHPNYKRMLTIPEEEWPRYVLPK